MVSSFCRIGRFSRIELNNSGFLGLNVDTYVIISLSVFSLTIRSSCFLNFMVLSMLFLSYLQDNFDVLMRVLVHSKGFAMCLHL